MRKAVRRYLDQLQQAAAEEKDPKEKDAKQAAYQRAWEAHMQDVAYEELRTQHARRSTPGDLRVEERIERRLRETRKLERIERVASAMGFLFPPLFPVASSAGRQAKRIHKKDRLFAYDSKKNKVKSEKPPSEKELLLGIANKSRTRTQQEVLEGYINKDLPAGKWAGPYPVGRVGAMKPDGTYLTFDLGAFRGRSDLTLPSMTPHTDAVVWAAKLPAPKKHP